MAWHKKLTVKTFIEAFFKIKTKEGLLADFTFNNAQRTFYKRLKEDWGKKPPRYIVLKARQLGISTLSEALLTCLSITHHHVNALIVAHDSEGTRNIFDMTKRYIENMPDALRPSQRYSNAKELVFNREDGKGLDSAIRVLSANNKEGSRSGTNRYVHLSELAFWQDPETAMTAIMQTVPNDNETLVIIESTANGYNYFHDLWVKAERGENDFTPIFFPWYAEPKYTMKYTGFELTDYEKDIKEQYGLSNNQLQWRRWCIANNCHGDERLFRQEYPITPEEAFILSGNSVFDNEIVLERMKHIPDPIRRGRYVYDYDGLQIRNIRWIDDKNGAISIYEYPTQDFTVLGGDTAGEGSDYFTGHVLDREGRQMAVLHQQFDEDLYAKQMYCLGIRYKSVMAIETNFSSFPVHELQRLNYPRMFVRQQYDVIRNTYVKRFGFQTTSKSRPEIIAQLVEVFRTSIDCIRDRNTLEEALAFVNIDGKPQASEGQHDDLIMGLAIAYEGLKQLPAKQRIQRRRDPDEDFFAYGG